MEILLHNLKSKNKKFKFVAIQQKTFLLISDIRQTQKYNHNYPNSLIAAKYHQLFSSNLSEIN